MGQIRSGRRVDVRRLIQRHRRGLAAVLAAGSVVALWAAVKPPASPVRLVVVAAGHLAPGQRLTPTDLSVVDVTAGLLPADALDDPDPLIGQIVASPIGQGEPVTQARLMSTTGLSAPPGRAVVPVRFEDAAATALLSPGHRIQVVASPDAAGDSGAPDSRVLASDALVLAVLARGVGLPTSSSFGRGDTLGESGSQGSWLASGSAVGLMGEGALTILAVSPDEAMAIAGAAGVRRLGYLWGPS